jgi:hypothetical protein
VTYNDKCFNKGISFGEDNQIGENATSVAGHAPAKLHSSPRIITTAVSLDKYKEEDVTHTSCHTTITPVGDANCEYSGGIGGSSVQVTNGF